MTAGCQPSSGATSVATSCRIWASSCLLQERGSLRAEYTGATLRENLGLPATADLQAFSPA